MGYIIKRASELISGDVLLHPIYREDGLLLINHYMELSETLIDYIFKKIGRDSRVMVAKNEGSSLEEFIANEEYKSPDYINDLKSIFIEHKNALDSECLDLIHFLDHRVNLAEITGVVNNIEKESTNLKKVRIISPLWDEIDNEFESERLNSRVKTLKNRILNRISNDETYDLLEEMKNYNNVLYSHSINSMACALLLGISIEMSDMDLENLAIATLFSDVGYTKVPKIDFLKYLSNGIETSIIKNHIKYSIEILRNKKNFNHKSIIMGIFDHHETMDGMGYPNNKKGYDISLFGKIIRIAKVYDSLAGGYKNHQIVEPTVVLRNLWDMRDEKLDSKILYAYILRTYRFKTGQKVLLNNGQHGIIIGHKNFSEEPFKPNVLLMNNNEICNLNNDENLQVVKYSVKEN